MVADGVAGTPEASLTMPNKLIAFVGLLYLPFLSGCVCPYCAIPKLDYTPSVKLESEPDEVHAFRVDISRSNGSMSVFREGAASESLEELRVNDANEVPAQIKPSVRYELVVIGIALNYLSYTTHSVALRLYRPGYELVEVRSWERGDQIEWRAAPGLRAQEIALDSLFPIGSLERGSESRAHRKALIFGACEYERLATNADSKADQTRLIGEANELREVADR